MEAASPSNDTAEDLPPTSFDHQPLAWCRDAATTLAPDLAVRDAVTALIDEGAADHEGARPLGRLAELLDTMRTVPRGDDRLRAMNTLVRTLGEPERLATFLDLLAGASQPGRTEAPLTMLSRGARKHSLYGWRSTILAASGDAPTAGTVPHRSGVSDFLEFSPAKWGLHLHVWQPNRTATRFPAGNRRHPGTVAEPPHSHPFDFASMVVSGTLRESTYAKAQDPDDARHGRYAGVPLEHVDGVWPPHHHLGTCGLDTVDDRVELHAGESYIMTFDAIHDVEVETGPAATHPPISLFLASEAMVRPDVFLAPELHAYHLAHPNLERTGVPLGDDAWRAKLGAIGEYLRGERAELDLDPLLGHDSTYAFSHA